MPAVTIWASMDLNIRSALVCYVYARLKSWVFNLDLNWQSVSASRTLLGNLEIPARSSLLRDVPLKGKWKPAYLVYIERQIKLRTIGVKSQRSSPFASCILDNVNKSELLQMLTSAFRLLSVSSFCAAVSRYNPRALNSAWAGRHVATSLLLCWGWAPSGGFKSPPGSCGPCHTMIHDWLGDGGSSSLP